MKTYFYNRSAYLLLPISLPPCFSELDEHFGIVLENLTMIVSHPSVVFAENICRRMADIELYAMAIANSEKDKDAFKGAIAIGSFLIGYTSACKSLLDACSITLNSLYNLSLKNKEQDFTKNKFWKTLETRSPETYSRYVRFHSLFTQIVKWRDAAVHRITPLVIVHSSGDPEKKPRDQVNIRLAANPNFNLSDIANAPLNIQWVEPLALHKQWHSDLIALCEQICLDIKLNSLGH